MLWVPRFKGQLLRVKDKLSMLFNVFVANDRLDGCVRVVNQELVDGLEGHFCLLLPFKAHHGL